MRDWMQDDALWMTRLLRRVETEPDRGALWTSLPGGSWQVRGWRELADDVIRAAGRLSRLGVGPGSVVAQFAENSYAWIIADLALLGLGAIHVPIHTALGWRRAAEQLRHCDAQWVLTSRVDAQATLQGPAASVPPTASVPLPCPEIDLTTLVAPKEGVNETGEHDWAVGRAALEQATRKISWDSPATILYTSGTVGEPKGVVLSHGNLVSNTCSVLQAFVERETERRFCLLPLSHIYARTCDLYVWLAAGTEMALATRPETVADEIRSYGPTFINGVPHFFDRIRRRLIDVGFADVPGALRAALGGKIELCVCGGAALPDLLFDFYQERGVPLLPGYGLTEASPVVTASTMRHFARGCVGRPLPGVEVRIAADGEILTRGKHVMKGYLNAPESTQEVLRDGWLHTGDLGRWSNNGLLQITGRKKELLVLATGKNVAPASIEQRLALEPFIAQVAAVGDERPCVAAIVVLNSEAVMAWVRAQSLDIASFPAAIASQPLQDELARRIAQGMSDFASHEQVRVVWIWDRPFSISAGECTPKLTICRSRIQTQHAEALARLYERLAQRPHSDWPLVSVGGPS